MKKAFILTLIALLLTAWVVPARTKTVDGNWDASMNTPGGAIPIGLTFKVEGEKLTGTVKRASGEVPIQGTIKGSDINFSYTINYNGNDLTLSFTGKVSGDTISGTVSFGGNAEDSWSAKRAAPSKPKTD